MEIYTKTPRTVLTLVALALVLPVVPSAAADVVTDPAGDSDHAFLDIVAIRAENDLVPTLDLVVEVDDMSLAVPSSPATITYTLDFCASNNLYAGQPICWRLNANDNFEFVTADFFRARVKTLDGNYCTVTGVITSAAFDAADNTVRWSLSKSALDFSSPPSTAATCPTGVRGGAPLADGNMLSAVKASTMMQMTGGTTIQTDETASGSYMVNSPVNFAPDIVAPGRQAVAEGFSLSFDVSANDVDGDTLTFSSPDLPAGAALDGASGVFTWTPGFDQEGDYAVTFTVDDGQGGTDSATVAIAVAHTNQAPVLDDIADIQAPRRSTVVLTVHAVDADGDLVAYAADNLPLGATFNPATGEFSWWASNSQVGQHSVTFRATDGSLEDAAVVMITITKH